jgi:hypothetical protein
MGYFANLEIEIMEMAQELGDGYGDNAETIKIISRALDVPAEEVQRVLDEDYDMDPREYAEESADLDAVHYGRS